MTFLESLAPAAREENVADPAIELLVPSRGAEFLGEAKLRQDVIRFENWKRQTAIGGGVGPVGLSGAEGKCLSVNV
jgi:hypothetical protein